MVTTETSLLELIQELSPTSRDSVRDFVEFLVIKQRRELAGQAEANGWPKGYFERTAGSIPDLPDRDMNGVDSSLDETVDELRFDTPEHASS